MDERTLSKDEFQAKHADLRLLFVDDEKRILQTVRLLLDDYGFHLRTASNGEEARELVRTESFDIIFLDQFIGKERGTELMQAMSAAQPGLYFVIITANSSADLAVEALKQGATDFIAKPFFAADILKSIEFVSRRRDLDNQRREIMQTLEAKVRERTQELENAYLGVLAALAQALESRDFGTYGHCKRVSHYAGLIADALNMDSKEKYYLDIGALLHDVGKIGISDFILLKTDRLETAEWNSLKNHPEKGVEILKPLRHLEPALPVILHHHENYDGTGYPRGLQGEDIPLGARIIAVADAWDVMLSDRPYRKARTAEAARKELMEFSGAQFDPRIVEVFLGLI